ncbi:peptidoglycan-binding domain-containing protein [Streptomyces sp. NPDC048665]|uniref:peptidoglycan-binding domain-containing protein n=1 Tax=unclassified Streptomyces TaxID=2593676 RepID=UPI00342F36F8
MSDSARPGGPESPGSPEGRTCPRCGAPRGLDRSPSCDCTERAAEALRETRTAEAAAAEDFDPLRIRPYVEVDEPAQTGAVPPVEATLPLRPIPGPSTTDLRMFEGSGADGAATAETVPGEAPRRRPRRAVLLSAAGAGVAVVAAAGLASGLFSYDTPSSRDRSAAQEVRASVPDVSAPVSSSSPAADSPPVSRSLARPSSAPPAPARPATPSASPTSAAPSPTASRSPSPTATASASARTTPAAAPVLRRGDQGPQVTELQERLRQLNLYADQVDGVFTRPVEDAVRTYQQARGITGDPYGEYGPATRQRLESETSQPSQQ